MPRKVYSGRSRAKSIPPAVQARVERRIQNYVRENFAGRFARIDVRFRGVLCYIDAYTEGDEPAGSELPIHLCRLRYLGNEDRWVFAWYTYAHEKYVPSFLMTGSPIGTPEEAFDTSALFF